jgi:hypothetical protein
VEYIQHGALGSEGFYAKQSHIFLGPTGYFESREKVSKPRNRLTVTGSTVVVNDTAFMIANTIKEGNEELQVRDNEGHPIWIGWKQIK